MASEQTADYKVESEGGSDSSPERNKRELEEEFNVQRAKMKELYLVKEDELRKLRLENEQLSSEVVGLQAEVQQLQTLTQNQKSEIETLQLLVNETVEASCSGSEEARRMRKRIIDLEQQLLHAKQQLQQQISLAPSTLVRNIARKLGGDAEPDQPQARKCGDDNEVLQSIVEKLEDENSALKVKLRDTDTQLQEVLKSQTAVAPVASESEKQSAGSSKPCSMCANYEAQLVAAQAHAERAHQHAHKVQHALTLATEELEGVRSIHDETIRSWQTERASTDQLVEELKHAVETATKTLEQKSKIAEEASNKALEQVTQLTVDRETLQKKLDTLERDNAMLIGQYTKMAMELQNEVIDLPDNVEELQEANLRLREQLIFSSIGREAAIAAESELRTQLIQQGLECQEHYAEMQRVRAEAQANAEELQRLQTEHEHMRELGDKLRQSSHLVETLLEDKKRLQSEKLELRGRVQALQHDLDNSEKVQQDFVRLSQSLQIQLEKFREEDTEVRWQSDEDVDECPNCHVALPNSKKKVHCRHCGRIFCSSCVSVSVASGPRGAAARVCGPCGTLLAPRTAPYFSVAPPT